MVYKGQFTMSVFAYFSPYKASYRTPRNLDSGRGTNFLPLPELMETSKVYRGQFIGPGILHFLFNMMQAFTEIPKSGCKRCPEDKDFLSRKFCIFFLM